MHKIIFATVTILLVAVSVAVCAPRPGPVIEELRDLDPKMPVIFLPGITGSKLRHKETGKVIWGRVGNLFGEGVGTRSGVFFHGIRVLSPLRLGDPQC